MRHASPPSKKRKPAKIGFSSFEEAQHPLIGDAWRLRMRASQGARLFLLHASRAGLKHSRRLREVDAQ